jgi:hypothetical protein
MSISPSARHRYRRNHQTHHRGQLHAMLTGLVGEAPELDLSSSVWRQSRRPEIMKTLLAMGRLPRGIRCVGRDYWQMTDFASRAQPSNGLKKRNLLLPGEFHSAPKRATK